jgi:hypothetical protein
MKEKNKLKIAGNRKRKIEMTDRQIDGLVSPTGTMYELYGLSEEEIKIVEQR